MGQRSVPLALGILVKTHFPMGAKCTRWDICHASIRTIRLVTIYVFLL